jgi:hypothetical protein
VWDIFCFWRPPFYLRSVLINLKTGEALSGVLWKTRGRWMVLRNATLMVESQAPRKIDGDAVIDRANVAFLQVL